MRNEVDGVARISRVLAITCLQIKVAGGKTALLVVQVCPRESVSYQWMRTASHSLGACLSLAHVVPPPPNYLCKGAWPLKSQLNHYFK